MKRAAMERMANGREYRIWRTAAKRHICDQSELYDPHYILPGEHYAEYVLMPGHDYNLGATAPWRGHVCMMHAASQPRR